APHRAARCAHWALVCGSAAGGEVCSGGSREANRPKRAQLADHDQFHHDAVFEYYAWRGVCLLALSLSAIALALEQPVDRPHYAGRLARRSYLLTYAQLPFGGHLYWFVHGVYLDFTPPGYLADERVFRHDSHRARGAGLY